MDREALRKHYEVLGLAIGASFKQVEDAYRAKKTKYAGELDVDGNAVNDAGEIISLDQIEEAHSILSYHLKSAGADVEFEANEKLKDTGKKTGGVLTYTGPILKQIREEMDFDLEDISATTKIPVTTLKNLESEKFELLPPEVYLRGFLKGISEQLALPADRVKRDYMERYLGWKKKDDKHRSLSFRKNKQ